MRNRLTCNRFTERLAQTMVGMRNRHFFILDMFIISLAPFIALWFRIDGGDSIIRYLKPLTVYTLFALVIRISIFVMLGMYLRYWRYAGIGEIWQILKAVSISTLSIFVVYFGILRPMGFVSDDFPRLIPFIDGLLILFAVGGVRYPVCVLDRFNRPSRTQVKRTRVLIFGAGAAGVMILQEMRV